MVRRFFLLSHFLVLKDYELFQNTSHLLSVPLVLKYVRILVPEYVKYWSVSCFFSLIVSLIMFCVRLLADLLMLVSAYDVTRYMTCHDKLR